MKRKQKEKLLLRPKKSNTNFRIVIAVSVLSFLLSLFGAYLLGLRSSDSQYNRNQQRLAELKEDNNRLRSALQKSQKEKVFAQRQFQIREEAYKQISKAYAASEEKNQYLGNQLDFYRSIISPDDGKAGEDIHGFDFKLTKNQLIFDVTLVQAIKHKYQVRGLLSVFLYDKDDKLIGRWPKNTGRSVNYQYFQQLSGVIDSENIANGDKIKVELILQGANDIVRWFDVTSNNDVISKGEM